jgi:hypothetical protein
VYANHVKRLLFSLIAISLLCLVSACAATQKTTSRETIGKPEASLRVWVEQSAPAGPVTVRWSPNPIPTTQQIRFQFMKCKPESPPGRCEGSLYAGIAPSLAPLEPKLPGSGRYAIKLSDFMSDRDFSDWVFFNAN